MNRLDMPDEVWRAVPGYEGRYEVSNLGRVYSLRTPGSSGSGRLLKPMTAKAGGYHMVGLTSRGYRWQAYVHLLVLLAFVGPRPDGQQVRHLDGDPTNNRLQNLRYGTRKENEQDKLRHGRHQWAKLTECHRGHPFDAENTRYRRRGGRDCRACYRERKAARALVRSSGGRTGLAS